MKYAANLSLLWPELPYLDRFEAAADAGFEAVEILFPYEVAAKETQRALLSHGLDLILINAPPPNYTGGDPGYAALVGGETRFQHDMRRAFRYAEALRPRFIHVMAGKAFGELARDTFVRNLRWAADAAPPGLILTIEPLCAQTMPGYFLNDYALAKSILKEVGRDNVALQYDSFHAHMLHGDAEGVYLRYSDLIRHVQIGDAPARNAPGDGEINFGALFGVLRDNGYSGWISGEYHPGKPTEETLGWRALL